MTSTSLTGTTVTGTTNALRRFAVLLLVIAAIAVAFTIGRTNDAEPTPPGPHSIAEDLGLTAREVDVLDQLARGRTDRQIADALFISKKTVSVHVSNILRKLDAANRVDAAEIGQRVGLGTDDGA